MAGMPVTDASSSPRPRGLFVALDGPDGGGKTTQAARLVDWLRSQGLEVLACRDPGGTPLGDRLRSILLDRETVGLSVRAEMLLYMASRAQLVEQVVRPALDAEQVVVSDRYLLANVVYQGYAGGLPVDEIWRVGEVATGGLWPDLTLLIDVPPEVAQARVGAPRDRMEDRPDAFRARVREGFLKAAETYPRPIAVIDGTAEPEAVAAQLRDEVTRALALRPRP
jgi:dTMP kinase